jgi:hypothetical protein
MTDRPDGTPGEAPDETQPLEAEPAVESEPAVEGEPESEPTDLEGAADDNGDELDSGDTAEEYPEGDEDADAAQLDDEGAATVDATGRRVGVPARPAWRRAAPPAIATRAPTVSEVAVHVSDPASRIFVIGTVVVFVGILLFGIFMGNGGILTGTPTPKPTAVPTASPSAGPSGSASAAPSGSGSAAPSGSGSAAPSASGSPAPSASASVAPSPSEAPAASPSPS